MAKLLGPLSGRILSHPSHSHPAPAEGTTHPLFLWYMGERTFSFRKRKRAVLLSCPQDLPVFLLLHI